MTLRSQTAALGVLLVAIAIIFVLVGETGVSTGVFLPEPTLTYTPTVGPTPTPLPDASAENWTEVGPNQWAYTGEIEAAAQLTVRPQKFDTFVVNNGLTVPAEDAPFPYLDVLGQMRDTMTAQADEINITLGPDTFTGPQIEIINGVPVSTLRMSIDAQETADGQSFPGLDIAWAFVDRGNDEISFIEYVLRSAPDPIVYNDFRAWLEANITDLAGGTEEAGADDTATTEGEDTAPPADAPSGSDEGETGADTPDAPADDATGGESSE